MQVSVWGLVTGVTSCSCYILRFSSGSTVVLDTGE